MLFALPTVRTSIGSIERSTVGRTRSAVRKTSSSAVRPESKHPGTAMSPTRIVANRTERVVSGTPVGPSVRRVKLEMLNAGWLTAAAGILRRDDDLDRQIRLPVPAYVIEADEERILVDTGLHPAAAADP